MTELALTSEALKRLFDIVDLEPMPQSAAVRAAISYWREKRENKLHVSPAMIVTDELPEFAPYVFIYATNCDDTTQAELVSAGAALTPVMGKHAPGDRIKDASESAYSQRAAQLFAFAHERGEPVCGTFSARFDKAGALSVEMLAAPLEDEVSGKCGIFGAIAFRHPEHGWEDPPAGTS